MEEEGTNIVIITARKRSLRRLCFYRRVSVHRGGVCVVGGHAWLLGGVCGCWGGGMHGCWGACMVASQRGHVWLRGARLVAGGMCGCGGCV